MAQQKYLINIPPKAWTILRNWFHIFIGGVLTEAYLHHTTSLKILFSAGLAAVLPLVYRYFDPSDSFPHPSPVLVAADAAVKTK